MTFKVSLSVASRQSVMVRYATFGGDPNEDYRPITGTLTFVPGQITRSVQVTILGESVNEGPETFVLRLSNAQNASISKRSGTCTINR